MDGNQHASTGALPLVDGRLLQAVLKDPVHHPHEAEAEQAEPSGHPEALRAEERATTLEVHVALGVEPLRHALRLRPPRGHAGERAGDLAQHGCLYRENYADCNTP
uniref:Uncharacterized protein n=1 Tax=Oxyrrhis marina TaxID=2969 RepID=A0A7S3USR7_OXYMA